MDDACGNKRATDSLEMDHKNHTEWNWEFVGFSCKVISEWEWILFVESRFIEIYVFEEMKIV